MLCIWQFSPWLNHAFIAWTTPKGQELLPLEQYTLEQVPNHHCPNIPWLLLWSFHKFDDIWLINSLIVVQCCKHLRKHRLPAVPCSPPSEGTNHESLQRGEFGQVAAAQQHPQNPKMMESQALCYTLIWLLIFLVFPLELTIAHWCDFLNVWHGGDWLLIPLWSHGCCRQIIINRCKQIILTCYFQFDWCCNLKLLPSH